MQVNRLPKYPESCEPEIIDYHLIVPLLVENALDVSDYNFTNIFAWQHAYQYKISQLGDAIITSGIHLEKGFILPPIGKRQEAAGIAEEAFKISRRLGKSPYLAVAPKWLADQFERNPHFKITKDMANWDYIHKSSDLAELPGQKFHSKRNLVKQFNDKYSATIEDLDTTTCAQAMEFSDRWCEQRDCESDEGLEKEKCAIFQMLTHFEALRLHGILVRVEGEIVGLTMGEELSPDTYVVHIEKGDHHLKGVYQYINQQLARRIAPRYRWINREQDLGVEGLRRAKRSYHPDHFIEKYRIDYI